MVDITQTVGEIVQQHPAAVPVFEALGVLFPRLKIIEGVAASGTAHPPAFFGSLINPIRYLMEDHEDAGELLRSLGAQTREYLPPAGACISYQALYHGLADIERDFHQHIHLENNILFPRAIEFEKANGS